jgi:hypothetical protein
MGQFRFVDLVQEPGNPPNARYTVLTTSDQVDHRARDRLASSIPRLADRESFFLNEKAFECGT